MPPLNDENNDLRSQLSAAMDEHADDDLVDDVASSDDTAQTSDSPAPAPEAAAPDISPAPAPEDASPPVASAPAPEAAPSPAAPTPASEETKAPGSWTPAAREKWAGLDPVVKEEVVKREREAQRALTMSSEARKFAHEFSNTIQPFLGFIAAENSTPLKAVEYMMRTGAALRVGTPAQKAQVVAGVIRDFGIDLQTLDQLLAGQTVAPNPQDLIRAEVQRHLAPVIQPLEHQRRQVAERASMDADAEIDAFASDPKHEFYNDVAPVMADLIEIAARRGESMSLTQAYERATLIHEPVRRVIEGRRKTEAARAANENARRARGAAVSVAPSAEVTSVVATPGDSVRSAVEFAISKTQGR